MRTIQQLFDLKGKTALITGGSRGLGLQIAEALGEQGARIVLSARKADELRAAQEHLKGLGIEADWIAADGSQESEIARLADEPHAAIWRDSGVASTAAPLDVPLLEVELGPLCRHRGRQAGQARDPGSRGHREEEQLLHRTPPRCHREPLSVALRRGAANRFRGR